jgi:catechol 1,2-dioxygenase
MPTGIANNEVIAALARRAAGLTVEGGNPRLKSIVHDLLVALFDIVDRHDISENEFWSAITFAQSAAPEFGLIVPGLGLEHYFDLLLDARDAQQSRGGGTPRTIEGPLFVEGAPLSDSVASLNRAGDKGEALRMDGTVFDAHGQPVAGAVIDVWHANANGAYSTFDPSQPPFNFRAKIRTGSDGRYAFDTIMPVGYSCPAGGSTEQLLAKIGRHGARPAHIHFFVRASGHRALTTQINIANDPLVNDDFAFATRDGLIPPIIRGGEGAAITFDFHLQQAFDGSDEQLSNRVRAVA